MPPLSLGQCQTNPRPSTHAEHIQPQHAGPPPTSLHAPLPQCTPRHAHSLPDQQISPVVLAAGGRQLGNIMHHLKSRLRKSRSTKDRRNTRATQDIALPVTRRSTARLSSFPSVQRSELPTPPAFSPAARWAEQCLAADAVTVSCWDCMAGHDRLLRWLRSDGRPANCSRSCLTSWMSDSTLTSGQRHAAAACADVVNAAWQCIADWTPTVRQVLDATYLCSMTHLNQCC